MNFNFSVRLIKLNQKNQEAKSKSLLESLFFKCQQEVKYENRHSIKKNFNYYNQSLITITKTCLSAHAEGIYITSFNTHSLVSIFFAHLLRPSKMYNDRAGPEYLALDNICTYSDC